MLIETHTEFMLSKYKKIDKFLIVTSYLFLAIPILVQIIYWFRWYVAIPAAACLIFGLRILLKNIKYKTLSEYKNIFDVRKLSIALVIILIFNVLSGAGGLMFQNWDYHSRNATLHDLVEKSWPVKYDFSDKTAEAAIIGSKDGMLSYYFAWFLPAAFVGKLTSSFEVASIFSFFWLFIGIGLFFYLLFRKLGATKLWYFGVFLAIAGLDIIAFVAKNLILNNENIFPKVIDYIDTPLLFFSSHGFLTHWFWVFHQAIPTWLVVMLFLNNPRRSHLGTLLALLLPYAPLPTVGLALIFVLFALFGKDGREKPDFKKLKELLSANSILSALAVVPIACLFLQNSSGFGLIFNRQMATGDRLSVLVLSYVLYLLCEISIFAFIVTKQNYRKLLAIIATLAILPLFYIGIGYDFGNRTTIPMIVLMLVLIIEFFNYESPSKLRKYIFIIILGISSITNLHEIIRSVHLTYMTRALDYKHYSDAYKTFNSFSNKDSHQFITNFVAKDNHDKFFNKYILR